MLLFLFIQLSHQSSTSSAAGKPVIWTNSANFTFTMHVIWLFLVSLTTIVKATAVISTPDPVVKGKIMLIYSNFFLTCCK